MQVVRNLPEFRYFDRPEVDFRFPGFRPLRLALNSGLRRLFDRPWLWDFQVFDQNITRISSSIARYPLAYPQCNDLDGSHVLSGVGEPATDTSGAGTWIALHGSVYSTAYKRSSS